MLGQTFNPTSMCSVQYVTSAGLPNKPEMYFFLQMLSLECLVGMWFAVLAHTNNVDKAGKTSVWTISEI